MALDLPNRHAAGLEAQNLVVEAGKMRLPFGDQLRLEAAGALARHRDLDLAIIGGDRLRAHPVAAVARAATGRVALLIAQSEVSSAPSARSIKGFFSCLNSPFSLVRSSGFS